MKKILLLFLALAINIFAQQTSVAVLPSEGAVLSNDELEALTDKMRESALKVLPTNAFVLLKQDVVVKRLGGAEKYIKECSESSCIVDLGKKAQVDYVAQASVGKLGGKIRLKVELYNVRTEGLVGMLSDEAENVSGLLAIVEKRIPAEVFGKIPGTSGGKSSAPSIAGGIGGVQIKGTDYEFAGEKRYLASISSDPEGASLSFNGVPDSRCTKTPCNVELGEGSVRIIAALEQYDMADTTVSIKQNNQSVRIRMKANFGVLEIKPAYSDGIGKDERWSLNINGKVASSWENRLSPNKYKVELSHRCYEDLSFDVGINRDKREVFDMASYVKLKKGGLVLNAERDGKPVSEVVFVNGVQVGETPFSGSVAVCARVEIGSGREKVDVNLKHNEKVVHTAKSSSYKPAVSAGNGFVAQPPTATQKAEGQKKLNALNSKAISVYRDTRGTIISISDVLFEFGKADLKPELKENLAEVASILKNLLTESTVIVEGHTDNVGKADANKKLSDQRASEVVKYLIGRGVDKKRLKSVGYGATKPIADNSTEAGKAKNRRVELVIKDG